MGRRRKRRRLGFESMLDQHRMLQSIASEYDLRMLQVQGKNGVFRVNTSQGWKKVKPFKYSQAELEYVHGALEHLAGKGWKRSMPLHLTKDGSPYLETPYGLFYVSTWVQGTEINPEDPFHLEMAAKVLGEMHRLLKDYGGVGPCHRQNPPSWYDKFGGQAEDLERYRQQAENARKGKFGHRFCKVADDFLRLMGIGLQMLHEADYDKLSQEDELLTTCHASPIASNIIAGNDGKIYITDFDNARREQRIYDLGRMVIRHSGWDVDKALFLIKSYQEANPLTREEIGLLSGLCAFPTRGWQVARAFFEQGRIHLGRLETAISELAKQEAFAKALSQIQPAQLVHRPAQLFQTIPYPEPVAAEKEDDKLQVVGLSRIMVEEQDDVIETAVSPEGEVKDMATEASLMVEGEVLPRERPEVEEADQVLEPFYWGDTEIDIDHREYEQLWALRRELASLARRLETISGSVFSGYGEQPRGGDGWANDQYVPDTDREDADSDSVIRPGIEIPVELPGSLGEETDTVSVTAEIGEYVQNTGVEVEVREVVGDLESYWEDEGEVRLDLAANMEHVNWEVPMETTRSSEENKREIVQDIDLPVLAPAQGELQESIGRGTEIPVEYAVGLDEDLVRDSVIQETTREVMPELEMEDGESAVVTGHLDAGALVPQEEMVMVSETSEVVASASKELDPGLEPEARPAEETGGGTMLRDESQSETPSSSRPLRAGTMEWAEFPKPLGGRRRDRERPST